jgi:hypothetical protein
MEIKVTVQIPPDPSFNASSPVPSDKVWRKNILAKDKKVFAK